MNVLQRVAECLQSCLNQIQVEIKAMTSFKSEKIAKKEMKQELSAVDSELEDAVNKLEEIATDI